MANKKNGNSLYKKMIQTAIGPVIILGIVIAVCAYLRFMSTMYDEAFDNMKRIADIVIMNYESSWDGNYSLKEAGDGRFDLLKGDSVITTEFECIDNISSKCDFEISFLYMDMRIHTTFKTRGGERFIGICANEETFSRVSAGEDAFYKDIKILDEDYIVFYTPVYNPDNTFAGMIEIARKSDSLKKDVLKAVWPVLLLTLGGVVLAAFVSYKNTTEIIDAIKKIKMFLGSVTGGDLQTELDMTVLKRNDELSEIGKASTAMQKSIRNFVETDPLTQLGNRRYVKNMLDKVKARSKENRTPFSVAIGDIDFFKKVNDTYGHNAGDEVLKAVAATLKHMMQGKGFAARWGGEEFIMVFDKMAMEDAGNHLRKILDNIRELVVETEGYVIKVTMTFGVVTGSDIESESMVEAADAKLYYGKQNGRNQVVVAVPTSENTEDVLISETSCESEE